MLEKKRPAFSEKPWPSEVVWMKASSTETVLSGATAMLAAPRNHGSTLAANPSSDSERLNPRVAGPIDTLLGNWTPLIA